MSEYIKMNDTPVYNYQKDIIKEKDKVINDLLKRISDLEFEVEKREQVVDKAIEELKNYENDKEANYYAPIKETLDILKGVDKE